MTVESITPDVISPVVRPTVEQPCIFQTGLDPAGKVRLCVRKATLTLNGKPLCDQHAELAMTSACGRNVKLARRQCGS